MPNSFTINHQCTVNGGRYFGDVLGGEAELTYRNRSDGVMVIDRTFVPPEARGGKIALLLVERAVADAKANGVKIVPQCPYVDKVFKRRPDLDALRA